MSIPLSQRPWLRRLLMLGAGVLLLLTLLAGYVAWHHASGLAELGRVQEDLAKDGRGSTIEDLLKDMPSSDRDRHEAWWKWQGGMERDAKAQEALLIAWDSDDARKWRIGLSAELPPTVLSSIEPFAKQIAELDHLLDQGPFIAGVGGHLAHTARPEDPAWLLAAIHQNEMSVYSDEWKADALLHIPRLPPLQITVIALSLEALSAATREEREQSYRRFDALLTAYSHPLGLLEVMQYLFIAARRDETHMCGALRQSLEPQRFHDWLNEQTSFRPLQEVRRGYRGERLLMFGCLTTLARQGHLNLSVLPRFERSGWGAYWVAWWDGPAGLAFSVSALSELEYRMERGPTYPYHLESWMGQKRAHPLAYTILPNLLECGATATQADFIARRIRVVAVLAGAWFKTRTLPSDITGLQKVLGENVTWLKGGADAYDMLYERLSDNRFRISIDLHATAGTFTPLDRYQRRADTSPAPRVSRSGTPSPLPRTDLPPKIPVWQMVDYEVWLPESPLPTK